VFEIALIFVVVVGGLFDIYYVQYIRSWLYTWVVFVIVLIFVVVVVVGGGGGGGGGGCGGDGVYILYF
jgi:hypothetical protein